LEYGNDVKSLFCPSSLHVDRDKPPTSEDDEVTHRLVGRDYFFTLDEDGSGGRTNFLRVCRTEFEQCAVREVDHGWSARRPDLTCRCTRLIVIELSSHPHPVALRLWLALPTGKRKDLRDLWSCRAQGGLAVPRSRPALCDRATRWTEDGEPQECRGRCFPRELTRWCRRSSPLPMPGICRRVFRFTCIAELSDRISRQPFQRARHRRFRDFYHDDQRR
jgi:hypothetical protein